MAWVPSCGRPCPPRRSTMNQQFQKSFLCCLFPNSSLKLQYLTFIKLSFPTVNVLPSYSATLRTSHLSSDVFPAVFMLHFTKPLSKPTPAAEATPVTATTFVLDQLWPFPWVHGISGEPCEGEYISLMLGRLVPQESGLGTPCRMGSCSGLWVSV